QRAKELAARPVAEGVERCVCGSADEVELAVAQRFIGLRDREKKLDRRLQPLLAEVAELDRGERRKIRRRDHVGDGDAECHADLLARACAAPTGLNSSTYLFFLGLNALQELLRVLAPVARCSVHPRERGVTVLRNNVLRAGPVRAGNHILRPGVLALRSYKQISPGF